MAKDFPESAIFYSNTAASSCRTIPGFRCVHLVKIGTWNSMDVSFRTAKSLENTISKRSPKFTEEIHRLPNSALPLAIGGKQSGVFLCLRGANKWLAGRHLMMGSF